MHSSGVPKEARGRTQTPWSWITGTVSHLLWSWDLTDLGASAKAGLLTPGLPSLRQASSTHFV